MSSGVKLSAQDKKDLEKFTKFLALKSAQIIVQSRLGEKIKTKCNPQSSGTDWFNLAITDVPEVLTEAKSAVSGGVIEPLCVEISLRTVDGDTMVLETWSVGLHQLDTPAVDPAPAVRLTYTAYNRMGILLKSLVSVTRVTPAYKLSRRQGPDSYIICYRIYMGQPQLNSLGEGYNEVRVGQVSTPVGSVSVCVAYRTKMTISPQHSKETIMLNSDHFRPDLSPKQMARVTSDDNSSLSDTIKIGAFAESRKVSGPEVMMPDVPFSRLLRSTTAPPSPPKSPPQTVEQEKQQQDTDNGNTQQPQPPTDDFILLDLKTPFAGSNKNTELGVFFRECQSAPPLQGYADNGTAADHVGDLTKQLEAFETSLREYDSVITQICASDNNN